LGGLTVAQYLSLALAGGGIYVAQRARAQQRVFGHGVQSASDPLGTRPPRVAEATPAAGDSS
jgi:hypothetical protein